MRSGISGYSFFRKNMCKLTGIFCILTMLAIHPSTLLANGEADYQAGVKAWQYKKCDQSIQLLQSALHKGGLSDFQIERCYINMSSCYQRSNQDEKAIEMITALIKHDPHNPRNYQYRARLHRGIKQYKPALADFITSLDYDPKNHKTYSEMGEIYTAMGEQEAAEKAYTKAITIAPKIWEPRVARGKFHLGQKAYEKAIQDYTTAIEVKPGSYSLYMTRARIYMYQKQWKQVIADLTKAIEIKPKGHDAYRKRGIIYKEIGQYEAAINDYTKALALAPKSSKKTQALCLGGRAHCWQLKADLDKAIADYEAALHLWPQYKFAKQQLAKAKKQATN